MYNRAHTNQITLQELATLSTEEARALRYVGRLPDTRLCSQERTKTQDKHQQRKQQQQNKRKRAEFLCRCIHEKFRPHLRRCTKKKVLLWQKKKHRVRIIVNTVTSHMRWTNMRHMVKCCDACTKEKKNMQPVTRGGAKEGLCYGGGYELNTGNANRKYSGLLTTKKQNEKTSISSDGPQSTCAQKKTVTCSQS